MPPAVVVAWDPSTADRSAIGFALALARPLEARVIVAAIRAADALAGVESDDTGEPGRALAALAETLRAEPRAELRVLRAASPAAGLQQLIADEEAGLAVLGSSRDAPHGRTRLGATAERALHGSPCPVAVVPRGHGGAPGPVTVGVLPGAEGRGALALAAQLARAAGRPLVALAVLQRSPTPAAARALAAQIAPGDVTTSIPGPAAILAAAIAAAAGVTDVDTRVLVGDPVDALLRAAARASLLVLGSRSYGPPGVVLPGGTALGVLAGARCPVLLAPRAPAAAAVPEPLTAR